MDSFVEKTSPQALSTFAAAVPMSTGILQPSKMSWAQGSLFHLKYFFIYSSKYSSKCSIVHAEFSHLIMFCMIWNDLIFIHAFTIQSFIILQLFVGSNYVWIAVEDLR